MSIFQKRINMYYGFQLKISERHFDLSYFGQEKRILSPYTSQLTVRILVQLEKITFRAVLIILRTAPFICSESDVFYEF